MLGTDVTFACEVTLILGEGVGSFAATGFAATLEVDGWELAVVGLVGVLGLLLTATSEEDEPNILKRIQTTMIMPIISNVRFLKLVNANGA